MTLHYFADLDKPVYYHDDLHANLKVMKSMVYHDRDLVLLVAGRTGTGKSVLSMQICKFLDPSFDISRIVYKGQEFINLANTLPKYSAIMLDESRESLAGEHAFEDKSKKMLDYLNEVRHKNLYIIFLMPDFWEFRTHLATQRSHAFIHVYERDNPDWVADDKRSDPMMRGFFDFYDFNAKRTLYYHNKKARSYVGIKPSFPGDFTNKYVVNQDAYRELKEKTTKKYSEDPEKLKAEEEAREPDIFRKRIPHYILVHAVVKSLLKLPGSSPGSIAKLLEEDAPSINKSMTDFEVLQGNPKFYRRVKVNKDILINK